MAVVFYNHVPVFARNQYPATNGYAVKPKLALDLQKYPTPLIYQLVTCPKQVAIFSLAFIRHWNRF